MGEFMHDQGIDLDDALEMTDSPPDYPGDGIRCPICAGETSVSETRQNRGSIRRRRRCVHPSCAGRVSTVEMVAPVHSKRATTTELVAMPRAEAADLAVVPRRVLDLLRELLGAG